MLTRCERDLATFTLKPASSNAYWSASRSVHLEWWFDTHWSVVIKQGWCDVVQGTPSRVLMAGTEWKTSEIGVLLSLWKEESVLNSLNSCQRNCTMYEMLSARMAELGGSGHGSSFLCISFFQYVILCPWFEQPSFSPFPSELSFSISACNRSYYVVTKRTSVSTLNWFGRTPSLASALINISHVYITCNDVTIKLHLHEHADRWQLTTFVPMRWFTTLIY